MQYMMLVLQPKNGANEISDCCMHPDVMGPEADNMVLPNKIFCMDNYMEDH